MKIGISGASGHLGQTVIAELQVRAVGHEIVAISRTPEKAPGGVEGRFGDYDQPASLEEAYAGLDRLLLIPTGDLRPGMRGSQNEAAINAAVAAGVAHVTLMSASGVRAQEEPAIGASYWRGEQALIRNAKAWTILRMNYYAEALAKEAASAAKSGMLTGITENKVAFISRDDVAAAAAGILAGDGHNGAIYNATGAKVWTGAERAVLLSDILGKEIKFVTVPAQMLTAGMTKMGLPADMINAIIGIQEDFSNGAYDVVTGDLEKLAGRPAKDLRDVLSRLLSEQA